MRPAPPLESFRLPPIGAADADYDAARRVWNAYHDLRPEWILRCETADEARVALAHAREHALQVAVRGGGHSFPGYGSCDGGVVVDLSPMRAVSVNGAGRRAQAGGGTTWRDVDAATAPHALAVPGGLVSSTGVGGLTLGGGIGWLARASPRMPPPTRIAMPPGWCT